MHKNFTAAYSERTEVECFSSLAESSLALSHMTRTFLIQALTAVQLLFQQSG